MTKLQLTKAIALARLYDRSRVVRSTKNSDRLKDVRAFGRIPSSLLRATGWYGK